MNKIIWFVVIMMFQTCIAASEPGIQKSTSEKLNTTQLEKTYIHTRDTYLIEFTNHENLYLANVDKALKELENQLKSIIGPVDVEGFPKQGKINLKSLLPDDLIFGKIDGLTFESNGDILFVTTNGLLNDYLAKHPELPSKTSDLRHDEIYYSFVFHPDAHAYLYVEIPVKHIKTNCIAYVYWGFPAQDIGPYKPEKLYVTVFKEDKVFLVCAGTSTKINEIQRCKEEWDVFDKKSSEALQKFRKSKRKDKHAFKEHTTSDEQGFDAYRRCYERETKHQPFFQLLKEQAQSIVDRIEKGN